MLHLNTTQGTQPALAPPPRVSTHPDRVWTLGTYSCTWRRGPGILSWLPFALLHVLSVGVCRSPPPPPARPVLDLNQFVDLNSLTLGSDTDGLSPHTPHAAGLVLWLRGEESQSAAGGWRFLPPSPAVKHQFPGRRSRSRNKQTQSVRGNRTWDPHFFVPLISFLTVWICSPKTLPVYIFTELPDQTTPTSLILTSGTVTALGGHQGPWKPAVPCVYDQVCRSPGLRNPTPLAELSEMSDMPQTKPCTDFLVF